MSHPTCLSPSSCVFCLIICLLEADQSENFILTSPKTHTLQALPSLSLSNYVKNNISVGFFIACKLVLVRLLEENGTLLCIGINHLLQALKSPSGWKQPHSNQKLQVPVLPPLHLRSHRPVVCILIMSELRITCLEACGVRYSSHQPRIVTEQIKCAWSELRWTLSVKYTLNFED